MSELKEPRNEFEVILPEEFGNEVAKILPISERKKILNQIKGKLPERFAVPYELEKETDWIVDNMGYSDDETLETLGENEYLEFTEAGGSSYPSIRHVAFVDDSGTEEDDFIYEYQEDAALELVYDSKEKSVFLSYTAFGRIIPVSKEIKVTGILCEDIDKSNDNILSEDYGVSSFLKNYIKD